MPKPLLKLFELTKSLAYGQNLAVLKDKNLLSLTLRKLTPYVLGDYLHDNYTLWLSNYTRSREQAVKEYIGGKTELPNICSDFIDFCFASKIDLDREKTLQSFEKHDAISDKAVKRELVHLRPKEQVNLLGFGLGTGYYERSIRHYLLDRGLAKQVKIYGFDPYAEKSDDISYLSQNDLKHENCPSFDVVTVRWVLHHVEMQERWNDFLSSINKCKKNDAMVLIVEHGYLYKKFPPEQERLYNFLVSTFDIIANIGIRHQLFTSTTPLGKNFYVGYLNPGDFSFISKGLHLGHSKSVYDVGPGFPNQTICKFHIK